MRCLMALILHCGIVSVLSHCLLKSCPPLLSPFSGVGAKFSVRLSPCRSRPRPLLSSRASQSGPLVVLRPVRAMSGSSSSPLCILRRRILLGSPPPEHTCTEGALLAAQPLVLRLCECLLRVGRAGAGYYSHNMMKGLHISKSCPAESQRWA